MSSIFSESPDEIPVISNVSSESFTPASDNFIQTSLTEYTCTENVTTLITENTGSVISEIISSVSLSDTIPFSVVTANEITAYKETMQFPLNLNTASAEQLMLIDGIGEVLSQRIIQYRENNGGFYSMQQLMEIEGIGEAKFEKFRQYLYIENESEYISPDNQQEYYEIPIEYNENEYSKEELITEQIIDIIETDNILSELPEETYVSDTEYYEEPETEETEIPMIELNSAVAEDFMKLPGIDEEMAYKIVEFREKIWYFSHPYELLYIDGMSESLLSSIIDYLYIEGKEDIIY